MKTLRFNNTGASKRITLFIVLLVTISCGSNNSKSESGIDSISSQNDVQPPAVDIHTAVITDNIGVVQQHIKAGSNINEKDPFGGSSPLISAAVFGKPAMAKILIEAGADINFQNNDGSTALHTSAYFCRPEIVRMLLDKGADKTIKNKYGLTAYEMVAGSFEEAKNGYDMIGKMLEPMGLNLDYAQLEKTRPEIAAMLK